MRLWLLKTALPWVWENRRLILVLVAAGALYGYGRYNGASTVKVRWAAAIVAEREAAQKEKDAAQQRANEHSASYQAEIAKQRRTINQLDKVIKNEIAKSYSTCVANDDLARLWQDTFSHADGGAAVR